MSANPLPAVTNLHVVLAQAVNAQSAVVVLSWDPVPGADAYLVDHVFRLFGGVTGLRTIGETTVPSFAVGSYTPFAVTPGATYALSVRACAPGSESPAATIEVEVPPYGTRSGSSPNTGATPLATVRLIVAQDSFQFSYPLTGPDGTADVPFVLDTGAFEMLLTQGVADSLGLPNLGPVQVSGIGGSSTAYQSQVTLSIGTEMVTDVHCVVDPTFTQNLFGARLLIDHGVAILVDPVTETLTFYQG